MKRRVLAAIAVMVLAGLWSGRAGATVMVEVPLEELILRADVIVHGVVERSGVAWELREDEMEPWTVSRLRVLAWLKGGDGSGRVVIRELGGVWQGGGRWIDGTPTYARGEEVIVFLRRDGHRLRTLGMVQGKLVVRHGVPGVPTSVHRDLAGISFARWVEGQMQVQPAGAEPAMELETLLSFIRSTIAAGGAR